MKHSIADSNRTQMFVTEWIDLLMSQRRQKANAFVVAISKLISDVIS